MRSPILVLLAECLTHGGYMEEASFVGSLALPDAARELTVLENRLPVGNSWRAVLLAKSALTGRTNGAAEALASLCDEMSGQGGLIP